MLRKLLLILFGVSVFVSCKNDLSLLAPYKESVSVYGLLDQGAGTQYIRIERVYLGAGDALVMAQNEDSVYFKPGDLTVTLQRFKSGTRVSVDNNSTTINEIMLTDTLMTLTGSGQFNPNARIYKTNHKIYGDSKYKLIIHNNKSGKEYTAETNMINFDPNGALSYSDDPSNRLLKNQPGNPTVINFAPGAHGNVVCRYYAPVNASVCGLYLHMVYTENGAQASRKSFNVYLGDQYTNSPNGGQLINLDYSGNTVYQQLAGALSSDNSFTSRTLDSISYLITTGGYDLALYNQVNSSTSLAQTKPNYTNINGGYGIFSCRNTFSLPKTANSASIDSLSSNPVVCGLRFQNQSGIVAGCH